MGLRWIDCGKGCRIRIDQNHQGEGRHLHWECRGKGVGSGVFGKFGEKSHGEDYTSALSILLNVLKTTVFLQKLDIVVQML